MTRVNLANLEVTLTRLADECKTLGTPFAVRRKVKDVLAVLPTIEQARQGNHRPARHKPAEGGLP